MRVLLSKAVLMTAVLATGMVAHASAALADDTQDSRMYRVTITNATRGQPVAPSVIATHTAAFQLFELGPAPMEGDSGYDDYFALATMAETGFPFLVLDQVSASPEVWAAEVLATAHTPPVLLPSESNSIEIGAAGNAKYLSAVAMLGRTNDGIYAVRGVPLPRGRGEVVRVFAHAYDVGSEANAESPASIGALGATDDDPMTGMGINENGEGYIHVHSGIHGVGGMDGLDPAQDDWRDPVVEVTVERTR